jgi:hypothetical protein
MSKPCLIPLCAVAALCASACNKGTFVVVEAGAPAGTQATSLVVTARNGVHTGQTRFDASAPFGFPKSFSLHFDEAHTGATTIEVIALDGTLEVGRGSGTTTVIPGETVKLAISIGQEIADLGSPDMSLPDLARAMLSFAAPVRHTVGARPVAVFAGDLHHMGTGDIATVDLGSGGGGNLSILLGDGQLHYPVASTDLFAGQFPQSIAAGDWNGDGAIDLVVADGRFGFIYFQNNGMGAFPSGVTSSDVLKSPLGIAAGKFSRGQFLDVVVLGPAGVQVVFGDGSGGWSPMLPPSMPVGSAPTGLAVGFVDGDPYLDVVVSLGTNNTVAVLLGNGDGTFQNASSQSVGASPQAVAVGDLNGDGRPEILTANDGGSVSVLLNNGNGTFMQHTDFAAGKMLQSLVIDDFDGDKHQDVAVTDNGLNRVVVLLGDGSGKLESPIPFDLGANGLPYGITSSDLDSDGRRDLIVTDQATSSAIFLVNTTKH